LVDHNKGQLDIVTRLVFPMPDLGPVFRSFGWHTHEVDATHYDGLYTALEQFKHGNRNGQPTAIICHSTKGYGAFSDFLNKHKVVVPDALTGQELALQSRLRQARVEDFAHFFSRLDGQPEGRSIQDSLLAIARQMHISLAPHEGAEGGLAATPIIG